MNRQSPRLAVVAGLVLGYASLIKVTAFLAVPGALLLARSQAHPPSLRTTLRFALLFLLPAVVVQLPWELWQWLAVGSPFPGWAGMPSERTIALNDFISYVTVVRSPWVYLTLTPIVVWTLVPGTMMLLLSLGDRKSADSGSPAWSGSWRSSVSTWRPDTWVFPAAALRRSCHSGDGAHVLGTLGGHGAEGETCGASPGYRLWPTWQSPSRSWRWRWRLPAGVQTAMKYDLAHIVPLFGKA